MHYKTDSTAHWQKATQYENTIASQGRILDADYATESANMTKHQIMLQSSVASLAQTKNIPSSLLALLPLLIRKSNFDSIFDCPESCL